LLCRKGDVREAYYNLVMLNYIPPVTKFMIVSRGRTGSTLLQLLLDSHPDIFMYGEQFGGGGMPSSPEDIYLKMNYKTPREYMDNYVFASKDGFRAIGFKLMYGHLDKVKNGNFEQYIQDRQIKVIHLVRKQMLDVCLSSVLAKETNKWVGSVFTEPVNISPKCCRSTFERYTAAIEEMDNLGGHKVYYSELKDPEVQRGMLDYLGVRRVPMKISERTIKQRVKSKREMILNYEELKECFVDTEYSKYFEEDS
jgi:hypothetical protein